MPHFRLAQHLVARRRRIAVRDDRLVRELRHRHGVALRERMRGIDEQHQLVRSERDGEQTLVAGIERDDAEVEAPLRHFDADLARRHPAHVNEDARVLLAEFFDQRQQHVHTAFVRSDQHAAALQVAKLAH